MGRTVVDQDDACRQRERAPEDLDKKHTREGQPDEKAAGRRGWSSAAADDGQVGREAVSEREAEDAPAVASQRAESSVDARVDEELEGDSYGAQDGHGETDSTGWHAETTCERKGEVLRCVGRGKRMGRVEAGAR